MRLLTKKVQYVQHILLLVMSNVHFNVNFNVKHVLLLVIWGLLSKGLQMSPLGSFRQCP